jgi:hypothetical protein
MFLIKLRLSCETGQDGGLLISLYPRAPNFSKKENTEDPKAKLSFNPQIEKHLSMGKTGKQVSTPDPPLKAHGSTLLSSALSPTSQGDSELHAQSTPLPTTPHPEMLGKFALLHKQAPGITAVPWVSESTSLQAFFSYTCSSC